MSLAIFLGSLISVISQPVATNVSNGLGCWITGVAGNGAGSTGGGGALTVMRSNGTIPGAEMCVRFAYQAPDYTMKWYYMGTTMANFQTMKYPELFGCTTDYCNTPLQPTAPPTRSATMSFGATARSTSSASSSVPPSMRPSRSSDPTRQPTHSYRYTSSPSVSSSSQPTPTAQATPSFQETPTAQATSSSQETPTAQATPSSAQPTPTAQATPSSQETPTAQATPSSQETPSAEPSASAQPNPSSSSQPSPSSLGTTESPLPYYTPPASSVQNTYTPLPQTHPSSSSPSPSASALSEQVASPSSQMQSSYSPIPVEPQPTSIEYPTSSPLAAVPQTPSSSPIGLRGNDNILSPQQEADVPASTIGISLGAVAVGLVALVALLYIIKQKNAKMRVKKNISSRNNPIYGMTPTATAATLPSKSPVIISFKDPDEKMQFEPLPSRRHFSF